MFDPLLSLQVPLQNDSLVTANDPQIGKMGNGMDTGFLLVSFSDRIICGPVWGSFLVWGSFAVRDHSRC